MPYLVEPVVASRGLTTRQPVIKSAVGDLVLRPWRRADAEQLLDVMADEAIQRWNLESLSSLREAEHWVDRWHHRWRKRTGASWAVTDIGDQDTVLGQVAFRSLWLADGLAELSCWVAPRVRRHHVGTEATRALTDWAFDEVGLERLEIVHSVRNGASCPVALRAGFDLEGVRRNLQRHADGFHDMCQHARIKADSGAPIQPAAPVETAVLGVAPAPAAPVEAGPVAVPDELARRRRARRAGVLRIVGEGLALSVGGWGARNSQG